jgi:two-component system OmpR family response regulator
VVVVEDEEHLAIGIRYNLEEEGYRVTTVGDGPSALAILREENPPVDLVILDIMLPGMSGYAVCEEIREAGNDVPILILSARTLTEDRVRGYDVGADQYLQKPFDLEELLSMTRSLIQRRGAGRKNQEKGNSVARFGRAVVNFDTFEVQVGGVPQKLTALQMKLLKHFLDHEGIVTSRNELLEKVWGMSHQPTTRTVDNFIVDLRKIFEIDPAQPKHFLSVRGAGYRFVANP